MEKLTKKQSDMLVLACAIRNTVDGLKDKDGNPVTLTPLFGREINNDTISEYVASCGIVNNSLAQTIVTFAMSEKEFKYELDKKRAAAVREERAEINKRLLAGYGF